MVQAVVLGQAAERDLYEHIYVFQLYLLRNIVKRTWDIILVQRTELISYHVHHCSFAGDLKHLQEN